MLCKVSSPKRYVQQFLYVKVYIKHVQWRILTAHFEDTRHVYVIEIL